MKVFFVFKVFVFLSTNTLATVCEDRFISAEFVVNSMFIYDQEMVYVIVSFAIFRHDITRPWPFQKIFCHLVFLSLKWSLFETTRVAPMDVLDLLHLGTDRHLVVHNALDLPWLLEAGLREMAHRG